MQHKSVPIVQAKCECWKKRCWQTESMIAWASDSIQSIQRNVHWFTSAAPSVCTTCNTVPLNPGWTGGGGGDDWGWKERRFTAAAWVPLRSLTSSPAPCCRGRWQDGSLRSCSGSAWPPDPQRGPCDTTPVWTPGSRLSSGALRRCSEPRSSPTRGEESLRGFHLQEQIRLIQRNTSCQYYKTGWILTVEKLRMIWFVAG